MFDIHVCDQLPKTGIGVVFSNQGAMRCDGTWNLVIRRETTEEDLELNSNFEMEGETIWETLVEICNCPFCGQSLWKEDKKKPDDLGKYTHRDYSSWKVKVV